MIEGGRVEKAPLDVRVSLEPRPLDPRVALAFFEHMTNRWPAHTPRLRLVHEG